MKPAIVVSAFTPGLAVIRSLGARGVPVVVMQYDDRDVGHVSKHVRELIRVPHPEQEEACFVDRVISQAPRFGRGLLVPASDAAVASISRHKDLLEQHYIVACADWSVTRLAIEKERTYALAEEAGVAVPKTIVPRSMDDAERYGRTALYPCLVKPSQGHLFYARFGTKMFEVADLDQLLRSYRAASEAGLDVVLQEIVPGPDSNGGNYNSYTWEGEPLVEFTAQKVRGSPPRFGSPRVALSTDVPGVVEPGRRLLRAMGFSGFACTEFKRDERDGVWKLMEVNGRHNLSGSLAVHCGVDFPWLQYRHLVDGIVPSQPAPRRNVYWIDELRDIGCDVAYLGREPFRARDYVKPYLSPHVFAITDVRDPKPFLIRCWNLLVRASAFVRRGTGRNAPQPPRAADEDPSCVSAGRE